MVSRIVDLTEGFERKLELADRLREVLSEERLGRLREILMLRGFLDHVA